MVSLAIKSPLYLELPDQLELVYTALPYFWATSSFFFSLGTIANY